MIYLLEYVWSYGCVSIGPGAAGATCPGRSPFTWMGPGHPVEVPRAPPSRDRGPMVRSPEKGNKPMAAADPHAMTAKEHIDEANEQLLNARVAGHGTAALQEHTQLAIAHATIAVSLNTMAVALNTLPGIDEPDQT